MPTFRELLSKTTATPAQQEQLVKFRELVVAESKVQNLTKLLSDEDFFYGHLEDCFELQRLGWLDSSQPNLDFGSGAGIPGIPLAILTGSKMGLVESETRKAEFLQKTVDALGLTGVDAVHARIEDLLKSRSCDAVLVRAVGSVEKLLDLLRKSSTWNRIILFKGPAFAEESKVLTHEKFRRFKVIRKQAYTVQEKTRLLIEIGRVKE